ncbi:MAG: hypothetical protein NTV22_19635 [bacterium]|nr:hypothetical protein [bacterium]
MEPPRNYFTEFFFSKYHAVLGLVTLGGGVLSGEWLGLIIGATAYTLGLIYLPDLPWFTRRVDRADEELRRQEELRKVAEFVRNRDLQVAALTVQRRAMYDELAGVCSDIEKATAEGGAAADGADPRLRKLDELMWTYLRLLNVEQALAVYLEMERREDVPRQMSEAETGVADLRKELDALVAGNAAPVALDGKRRLLTSRSERLDVLYKRVQRIEQAKTNVEVLGAEQERLAQQIKLIRADAIASKNTEMLTARIDASVQHLDQTNKWLSEMADFKDVVGDLPASDQRIGFAVHATPAAAAPAAAKSAPARAAKTPAQTA